MSALAGHHFRHLPLSPPDTDASIIPPLSAGHPGVDFDMSSPAGHYQSVAPERTRLLPRRGSALSYQPGARDLRDRTGSYSRGPRNLVVVIPPPDFPLDHGQLGNVLSMGPRHRLSQGILMPLFPSMFGQLNAIAREYNFPSTVGLCLYLHINENGITMTPRISDDSWQYLFGHLFENRAPSSTQQLPIGGSIEFDIDLSKARWFDAWVSGTLRDPDPIYPPLGNSHPSLGAHWRGESQPRGVYDQPVEDRWDASTRSHTLVTNSQPATLRHVPKKLSLVDRLETLGLHVPPKSQNHLDHPESPPTQETPSGLSPIPQSAIPRVAKADLELRVNTWRETTELYSVSMTEAYQPEPDVGVSVGPTTMDAYAMERNFQQSHEAYTWSPTSAGPRGPALEPQFASPRPSSVHLEHRVSVPITPATATSWGPADDEWHSVVSTVSRLPSPDTGERVVEDTMAPRRSAVWGNSFGWRTATTWNRVYPCSTSRGKPGIWIQLQDGVSEYPNLVIYPAPILRPNASDHPASALRSVWGGSFGWHKAVTWQKVYPYSVVTLHPTATIQLPGASGLMSAYPNLCIYPAVYPHLEIYPAVIVEERTSRSVSTMFSESIHSITRYPTLVIYPAVYPHFDIYPAVAKGMDIEAPSLPGTRIYSLTSGLTTYPNLVIYPAVYPHFDLYPKALQVSRPVQEKGIIVKLANAGGLTAEYPTMAIYPSVYPYLDIYPARETVCIGEMRSSNTVWGISFGWSIAKTWLQVYPLHVVNPLSIQGVVDNRSPQPFTMAAVDMAKKEAVWEISFGWKDARTWRAVWPTAYPRIYPEVRTRSVSLHNDIPSNYPYLVIYPTAYPHFAIYPPPAAYVIAKETREKQKNHRSVHLVPHYPNLVIYPAVYPNFDLYPAFATDSVYIERGKEQSNFRRRRIAMWRARTAAQLGLDGLLANNHCWEVDEPFRIDLADYAWSRTSAGPPTSPLELLSTASVPRSVDVACRVEGSVLRTPSIATTWGPEDDDQYSDIESIERLPSPDIGQRVLEDDEHIHRPWRMVWPFYKATDQVKSLGLHSDDKNKQANSHQLWRTVWPFISTSSQVESSPSVSVFVHIYPHLVVYPPVYPHFDLYPARACAPTNAQEARSVETLASTSQVKALPSLSLHEYPHLVIYPPVYPHFGLYPACAGAPTGVQVTRAAETLASSSQAKALPSVSIHKYPHLMIYPPLYPHFDLYPAYANAPTSKNQVTHKTEILANQNRYPVFDIYPAIYPYFNIYPAIDLRREICINAVSTARPQAVEVTLPSLYPNLDIYPAGYPFNLDSIYPFVNTTKSTQITVGASRGYPWLVIYQPVYPFVIPYPGFTPKIAQSVKPEQSIFVSPPVLKPVDVRLPVCYPTFDLYPAGYPWSLESVYPVTLVNDYAVDPRPFPLVQLTSSGLLGIDVTFDRVGHKASLAMPEDVEPVSAVSTAPPCYDLFPAPPTEIPQRGWAKHDNLAIPTPVTPRIRKTHKELHDAVFRSLGKRPARATKTHLQLHNEVFQDGVVWTPSGYAEDLSHLTRKKPRVDLPIRESPRRPSQDSTSPRTPRSRPVVLAAQSPDKVMFPLVQPPALPPISPLRVRSPGIPSQPSPAVSESPMPRVSSPTNAFTHKRTTSSRLTQAVKSIMPGLPRRSSSASRPTTPPLPEEHKQPVRDQYQHQQTPVKFPSLVERRLSVVPPLPHTDIPELLARVPPRKESLVLQRARAYEQSTTANPTTGTTGPRGTHVPFTLPPLPSIPPMTDMVETFEKSKLNFP